MNLTYQVLVIEDGIEPFFRLGTLAVFFYPLGVSLLVVNKERKNSVDTFSLKVLFVFFFVGLFLSYPFDVLHNDLLDVDQRHQNASCKDPAQIRHVSRHS